MPQVHDDSGQVFVSTLVAVLRPPKQRIRYETTVL